MYCPYCETTYSITKTIINLHNLPVDEDVEAKFCPVCGWSLEPKTEFKKKNIYNNLSYIKSQLFNTSSKLFIAELSDVMI